MKAGLDGFDERKYNGCARPAAASAFRNPHLCTKRQHKETGSGPSSSYFPSGMTWSKIFSFLSLTFLICKTEMTPLASQAVGLCL